MPTLRELLNRFRPAGAPGAPGSVAVPADRAAELADELRPIFEALAVVRADVESIRSAANTQATARRTEAAAAAVRIIAEAHRATDAERAAGHARARAGVEAAATSLTEDGRLAADAVRQRAQKRLPCLVSDVVAAALTEVSASAMTDQSEVRS